MLLRTVIKCSWSTHPHEQNKVYINLFLRRSSWNTKWMYTEKVLGTYNCRLPKWWWSTVIWWNAHSETPTCNQIKKTSLVYAMLTYPNPYTYFQCQIYQILLVRFSTFPFVKPHQRNNLQVQFADCCSSPKPVEATGLLSLPPFSDHDGPKSKTLNYMSPFFHPIWSTMCISNQLWIRFTLIGTFLSSEKNQLKKEILLGKKKKKKNPHHNSRRYALSDVSTIEPKTVLT